tara:strand:+ start:3098 stop:3856 length:759 start_codon:yes stop_codon:yes gene_type:complete
MNNIIKLKLIFILFLIFFTPQYLSDFLYGLFGEFEFYYKDKYNRILNFKFRHKNYDGMLMSYYIKENLVKYKRINNIKIFKPRSYQYLNNKRILNYSKLTSSISNLLLKIIKNQKRKINICIIVSIRHKLINKFSKGNFIKFAKYSIDPSDNLLNICKKHDDAVKNVQSKNYLVMNTTIYDWISTFYNIDYIFNCRKNLNLIKTKNNNILVKQFTKKITKNNIYNLINIKNKQRIIIEHFNNKYIISDIIRY